MNFWEQLLTAFSQSDEVLELIDNPQTQMNAYVEPHDTSGPFIIVTPLEPPALEAGMSNTFVAESQHYQIDVQAYTFNDTTALYKAVRKVMMREFNMYPQSGGLDEWFEETQRFVQSVNFIGTPQHLNYKKSII